jgi:hypothetical protein
MLRLCIILKQHIQVATTELRELEGEVQNGFTMLHSMVNGHKAQIEALRLDWQRKFGPSHLDP